MDLTQEQIQKLEEYQKQVKELREQVQQQYNLIDSYKNITRNLISKVGKIDSDLYNARQVLKKASNVGVKSSEFEEIKKVENKLNDEISV